MFCLFQLKKNQKNISADVISDLLSSKSEAFSALVMLLQYHLLFLYKKNTTNRLSYIIFYKPSLLQSVRLACLN